MSQQPLSKFMQYVVDVVNARKAAGEPVFKPGKCSEKDQKHYDEIRSRERVARFAVMPEIMERRRQGECIHLGQVLNRCPLNDTSRDVRLCRSPKTKLAHKCTPGLNIRDIEAPSCLRCPAYHAPVDADGFTRHLVYFIYPVSGNGVWQWNVDELKKRISLFNGRRIIAVANDRDGGCRHKLDSIEEVKERLGKDFEHVMDVNSRNDVGEVVAFRPMLEYLQSYNEECDVTFYGHAKGVTKPMHSVIPRWTKLMYQANLDQWPTVMEYLRNYPMTGAFQSYGDPPDYRLWVYSGTFFWFRNRDVFRREWRRPAIGGQFYAGTELWPNMVMDFDEAACHFYGGVRLDMYSEEVTAHAERCYRQRFGVGP